MILAPGSPSVGKRTSALWEAVDLWPTMSDLAMNETPPRCPSSSLNASCALLECADGISAKPLLLTDWSPAASVARKDCATSQVPRGALVNGEPVNNAIAAEMYMGYTVRTAAWRYISWVRFDNLTGVANWSEVVGRELYPQTL